MVRAYAVFSVESAGTDRCSTRQTRRSLLDRLKNHCQSPKSRSRKTRPRSRKSPKSRPFLHQAFPWSGKPRLCPSKWIKSQTSLTPRSPQRPQEPTSSPILTRWRQNRSPSSPLNDHPLSRSRRLNSPRNHMFTTLPSWSQLPPVSLPVDCLVQRQRDPPHSELMVCRPLIVLRRLWAVRLWYRLLHPARRKTHCSSRRRRYAASPLIIVRASTLLTMFQKPKGAGPPPTGPSGPSVRDRYR